VPHLVQHEPNVDREPVAYSSWYDTLVVLRVATARTRELQTELHCTITGESDAAVHIRMVSETGISARE
jgi:hypothetical protein